MIKNENNGDSSYTNDKTRVNPYSDILQNSFTTIDNFEESFSGDAADSFLNDNQGTTGGQSTNTERNQNTNTTGGQSTNTERNQNTSTTGDQYNDLENQTISSASSYLSSNRQRQNNKNVSVFLNPGDKQNSISQRFQKDDELMNNSIHAQIIKDLIASVRKLFLHKELKDYEAYPDIYDFVSVIIDNDTMPEKKNLEKFKSKIDIELLKTIILDTSLQNTDVILTVKNLLGLLEKDDCKKFMLSLIHI